MPAQYHIKCLFAGIATSYPGTIDRGFSWLTVSRIFSEAWGYKALWQCILCLITLIPTGNRIYVLWGGMKSKKCEGSQNFF